MKSAGQERPLGTPFGVDLWQEDAQIYDNHRTTDARIRRGERRTANTAAQDQAKRRMDKVTEVDVLGNLRKERKRLQEDQRELKARLDLDKVDRRCAAAQSKADARLEAHQLKLAEKGHLDRMASDVFTQERLNPRERLERIELERSGKLKLAKTDTWRPKRNLLFGSGTLSQQGSILANSAPSVLQQAEPLSPVAARRINARSSRLSELTIDEEDPLSPKAEQAVSMLDQAQWSSFEPSPADPYSLAMHSPARLSPGHKL